MGMRQNIRIDYQKEQDEKPKSIYIYSHWDGDGPLKEKLKQALIRGKERWHDESYLTRIIFSEIIRDDIDGLTGYGLAPYEIDPEYPTIIINMDNLTVDNMSFEDFIRT